MTGVPVFPARVELESGNRLGEGIMWDEATGLLHWVDIDRAEVHSYDPVTKAHAVDVYPETSYVTALSPRKDAPGLVAAFESSIVLVNPTTPTTPATRVTSSAASVLARPLSTEHVDAKAVRFNDGACDPAGRFWVGSMTLPEARDGKMRGELVRLEPDGSTKVMIDGIGTSNGIDWSPDGTTMYYIDSDLLRVDQADYDVATGEFSNRRPFATQPKEWKGAFDGLVVDGVGNVWVARWGDSRVLVYAPDGRMLAEVPTPGARSPTIPCFGGKNLDTLYIATAHSDLAGQGDIQAQFPHSGDVFALDCGPGSPIRQVLGAEWTGRVRHRFRG